MRIDPPERRLSILPPARRARTVVAASLALLASAAPATPIRAEVTEIDRPALEALIADGVAVIDVRREDEWRERGVIEGSHLLTFFDANGGHDANAWLAALADVVERDEPLVLVCAHGIRSGRIAALLDERLGFTKVHDVGGGLERWRADGGRVEPYVP